MNEISLRFNAGVEYKGKVYASAVYINGLFQLDLITKELTYIKCFAKESPCFAIHRCAFLHGNEAWFIPQMGKYIAVVNLETLEILYIEPPFKKLNEKAVERINAVYYSGGIINDKFLYLIPTNIDTLLLIDLDSKNLYPYYDIPYPDEYFLFGTYAKGSIYLMPYVGKSFVEINLRTNERNRFLWEYSSEEYLNVVCNNSKIFFGPSHSKYLLIMDLDTSKMEEISVRLYDDDCIYEQMIIQGNLLFIIPFYGDKVLKYEMESNKVEEINLGKELLVDGKNSLTEIYSKNNIILASSKNNFILIYDKKQKEFQKIKITMKTESLVRAIKKNSNQFILNTLEAIHKFIFMPDGFYNEILWGVNNYIHLSFEDEKNSDIFFVETIGNKIWNCIRG